MNARQHAARARALIQLCGGVEEAASTCRVSASHLSAYQNPDRSTTMPADVICDLEAYCGKPVYSQALLGACQATGTEGLTVAINALDDAAGALRSEFVKTLYAGSADGRDMSGSDQDRIAKRMAAVGLAMIEASRAFTAETKSAMARAAE